MARSTKQPQQQAEDDATGGGSGAVDAACETPAPPPSPTPDPDPSPSPSPSPSPGGGGGGGSQPAPPPAAATGRDVESVWVYKKNVAAAGNQVGFVDVTKAQAAAMIAANQADPTDGSVEYHYIEGEEPRGWPPKPAAAAPTNTAAPVLSGQTAAGATLTVTDGTWTGQPAPAFSYVWKAASATIPGATGKTYVIQAADSGKAITVEVTATNATGTAKATSNAITAA